MKFNKIALTCATMSLTLALSQNALGQTKPANATDAQANAVIDQLIKSGKLDTAVDASVRRFFAAREAESMKSREAQMARMAEMATNARKVTPSRDHIFGNQKAEWSFIVYSDLECPFCKEHSGIPEAVAKSIGLDKINVVFRHFPLPMHGAMAKKLGVASECVAKQGGSEGFFKFVDTVLRTSALNGKGLPGGDPQLVALAKDAGVKDEKQFDACMQDPQSADAVKTDYEDGEKAGVSGTPGNILRNNKTGKSIAFHGYNRGGAVAVEATVRQYMAGGSPAPVGR